MTTRGQGKPTKRRTLETAMRRAGWEERKRSRSGKVHWISPDGEVSVTYHATTRELGACDALPVLRKIEADRIAAAPEEEAPVSIFEYIAVPVEGPPSTWDGRVAVANANPALWTDTPEDAFVLGEAEYGKDRPLQRFRRVKGASLLEIGTPPGGWKPLTEYRLPASASPPRARDVEPVANPGMSGTAAEVEEESQEPGDGYAYLVRFYGLLTNDKRTWAAELRRWHPDNDGWHTTLEAAEEAFSQRYPQHKRRQRFRRLADGGPDAPIEHGQKHKGKVTWTVLPEPEPTCGDACSILGERYVCTLPAGHDGRHQSADDASWGRKDELPPEPRADQCDSVYRDVCCVLQAGHAGPHQGEGLDGAPGLSWGPAMLAAEQDGAECYTAGCTNRVEFGSHLCESCLETRRVLLGADRTPPRKVPDARVRCGAEHPTHGWICNRGQGHLGLHCYATADESHEWGGARLTDVDRWAPDPQNPRACGHPGPNGLRCYYVPGHYGPHSAYDPERGEIRSWNMDGEETGAPVEPEAERCPMALAGIGQCYLRAGHDGLHRARRKGMPDFTWSDDEAPEPVEPEPDPLLVVLGAQRYKRLHTLAAYYDRPSLRALVGVAKLDPEALLGLIVERGLTSMELALIQEGVARVATPPAQPAGEEVPRDDE